MKNNELEQNTNAVATQNKEEKHEEPDSVSHFGKLTSGKFCDQIKRRTLLHMGGKNVDVGGTVGYKGCGELSGFRHWPPHATYRLVH